MKQTTTNTGSFTKKNDSLKHKIDSSANTRNFSKTSQGFNKNSDYYNNQEPKSNESSFSLSKNKKLEPFLTDYQNCRVHTDPNEHQKGKMYQRKYSQSKQIYLPH